MKSKSVSRYKMAKHTSKKKYLKDSKEEPEPVPKKPAQPHPLHIPLVVNQVMSSLGVTDLLRARLVCQQWNAEASKYMQNNLKLKLYRSVEVSQVTDVMRQSRDMFQHSLKFDSVHLEARLSPIPPKSRAFQVFFSKFAPNLKSLSLKQTKWDSLFPLHRLPLLQQLTIQGNLNEHSGLFPNETIPYLPHLKRINFHLDGRITTEDALGVFASNITALVNAAPNLEEIIAPKKMDHRDETADSYRDDTANHILIHMLASDRNLKFLNLQLLQIDAKLLDQDLIMFCGAAAVLPKLETLGIALSGASTRGALISLLRAFSGQLKHLSMSYSKTHGTRMNLTGYFMEEPAPLQNLMSLSLKNYPASVAFLGAMKQLESFTVEVRNIEDCFPSDRDDFFLQPSPHPPSSSYSNRGHGSCSPSHSSSSSHNENRGSNSERGSGNGSGGGSSNSSSSHHSGVVLGENRSSNRMPVGGEGKRRKVIPNMDLSKTHSLKTFHYIHNKEGTKINLFGDRCPFPVTRRVAMRFPLVSKLTLDNMTGESMACIIKYLPLLEELNALGGFYNDLSIVGASSKEQMKSPDFPATRKLPFIGDLIHLHTLCLATFSISSDLFDKTDLLSDHSVYHGLIHCKNLRRLTLGADVKNRYMRSNFETNIGDRALKDLIDELNLISLKTVRCPMTARGFREILQTLRDRGITYSINSYEGPMLPEEFHKKHRFNEPEVQVKRLNNRTNPSVTGLGRLDIRPSQSSPPVSPSKSKNNNKNRLNAKVAGPSAPLSSSSTATLTPAPSTANKRPGGFPRRKRKYGQYKF